MNFTNFPKTVNPYVSMTYRLVQRCNASYKDFIFAPIDQVNPLRALFRPLKTTFGHMSAYRGSKNTRITVISIGYGVPFRGEPFSYRPSANNGPLESPPGARLWQSTAPDGRPKNGARVRSRCKPHANGKGLSP